MYLPTSMTGIIFDDLKRVWVGKSTYFRAEYCAQLDITFDTEDGAYMWNGALFTTLVCCL